MNNYEPNQNQIQQRPSNKKTHINIIIAFLWLVCISYLIAGLKELVHFKILSALLCFILTFFLCPKAPDISYKLLKYRMSRIVQVVGAVAMLFISSFAFSPSNNTDKKIEPVNNTVAIETTVTEETTIETTVTSETTTIPEITTQKATTTKATTKATTAETTTIMVKYETNQLFDDVFIRYCDLSKVINFDMACEKLKTFTQYKIDYTEPTDDDLGEITLTDDNGNYVYIISYPLENLGVETITLIGYVDGKTGNEIAVSDEIHTVLTPEYHIHDKSKEKPNRKASSLQELIEFMFPVKTVETTDTTTTIETTTAPIITTTTLIETEPPETQAPAPVVQERHVYVAASGNGSKYHSDPNCSRMNGNVIEYSISDAESRGYTPCKKCY